MCERHRDIFQIDISFLLFIIIALVLGSFLRLYLIFDQLPLDDEWHGMEYVIGNSFRYLLTHSGWGATCIPMNLYRRFLLTTFGWSELSLILPSLAAGILGLAVLPVLVRKLFSRRATIIFVFLLAVSPFLIFYSRVCRPYSIVAFLGFLSILALYFWAENGERKYAIIYVAAAILSVYLHLFAVIAVLAPLCYLLFIKLMRRLAGSTRERFKIIPTLPALTIATVTIGLLSSILLLPSFIQGSAPTTLGEAHITLKSLFGFASMLSGTANKFMMVFFWALLGFGQIRLLQKNLLLGTIFFSIIFLCLGILAVAGSTDIHIPIVISRYVIPVFPLSFVLAAFGIDAILKYFQSVRFMKNRRYGTVLTNLIAAAFLTALFLTGPLTWVYARPNNFTNHSAFQESYEPFTWEKSYNSDMIPDLFIMNREDIPHFYQRLSSQPDTSIIIEYPMKLWNNFNLYYYYQHFHKKKIIVGYFTKFDTGDVTPIGYVTGAMVIDHVFSRLDNTGKLTFSNMVNMMDIKALKHSRASYIILHKNIMAEMFPQRVSNSQQVYAPVTYLIPIYQQLFGPAIFEDYRLIVFKIPSTSKPQ